MEGRNYDPTVFQVQDPPCSQCHAHDLEFRLYENYGGSGVDWLQWFCENCGNCMNVEIV